MAGVGVGVGSALEPLIRARADPFALRWDGAVLFVATDDTGGDNVASSALSIRSAATVADLAAASEHVLLRAGECGLAGSFWAPELHVIAGVLHCFFAPSVGRRTWTRVQAHVMTLRTSGDPLRGEDWSRPRAVLKRDGTALGEAGATASISLDMTCFTDAGTTYLVWSQRGVEPTVTDAELWIARGDPERIDRLASDPVRLLAPLLDWEGVGARVVEGPAVTHHDGVVHLLYAAASVGPDYATGHLSAPSGADLLDPGQWQRSPQPVISSDPARGLWGPGHASFLDDDGREAPLVLLHCMRAPSAIERDTVLGRVEWHAEHPPTIRALDRAELARAAQEG